VRDGGREKQKAHDEPAEDGERTGLGVGGICDGGEEAGALGPVGWTGGVSKTKGRGKDMPGNSVSDVGERMKGGAVRAERSPETAAILAGVSTWSPVQKTRTP